MTGVQTCALPIWTSIAQLDQVETAKREAERTRLIAECTIAAAVSKVYEDSVKEDAEQYLEESQLAP